MKNSVVRHRLMKGLVLMIAAVVGPQCMAMVSSANAKASFALKHEKNIHATQRALIHRHHSKELLVKFRDEVSVHNSSQVAHKIRVKKAKKFSSINKIGMRGKAGSNRLSRWWRIHVPADKTLSGELARLSKHPDVEYVEPNYVVEVQGIPNDARFGELWGMNNSSQTGGVVDADIDAAEAWDLHTNSDLVVAVIDTGVDYNHEDLAANMWVNTGEIPANGIDDDGNGYIDDVHGYDFRNSDPDPFDDHGHGSHCSGTIAAVGNNSLGVAGVSWSAKIMALKFLGSSGSGYIDQAVSAVVYATNNGANILNNSWGGGGYSQALADAISDANDAGVLFVAAAGNSNSDNDRSNYYPANYDFPNVITVAAVDHNDDKAYFSSYGASTVEFGAPGVDVLSTVPTGVCELCSSDGYRLASGTSMAAPHVSGAIALLWSYYPQLTAGEIKRHLASTVDLTPAMAGVTISDGRLNVDTALRADYRTSFSPGMEVFHGSSSSHTLTITSFSTENRVLNLSLGALPPGLVGSLGDSVISLPAGGSVTTTVTIDADYGMARGNYPVKVFVQDGNGVSTQAL